MKVGLSLPHAGASASTAAIALAARGAEEVGLDSVWVLDRWLRPLTPVSPDGSAAEPLPSFYSTIFDPIDTLA